MSEGARSFARRLSCLSGGAELVRKAVARELAAMHPADAMQLIADLLVLSRTGDPQAGTVMAAVSQALALEADVLPDPEALKRLASIQQLSNVEKLFVSDPPRKEMDLDAAARADAKLYTQSLGHLKAKARLTKDPDELSRLAVASEPTVVRNVLLNPRLTEELVVRIAARRPARPEPLREIWSSARWSCRHAVRRALVFNPYLPVELGVKIVPLLDRVDLIELSKATEVHPVLREQARQLLVQPAPPNDGQAPSGES